MFSRQKNIKSDVRDGWTMTRRQREGRHYFLRGGVSTRTRGGIITVYERTHPDLRKLSPRLLSTTVDINFTIYRQ